MSSQKLKTISEFLGPKTARYFLGAVIIGMGLSAVELGFAFSLQGFLVATGLLPATSSNLSQFIQLDSINIALGFVLVVAIVRAGLNWLQSSLNNFAFENQKRFQRDKLMTWALTRRAVNSAEVVTRYNEQTGAVSNIIGNAITLVTLVTTATYTWAIMLYMAWFPTVLATAILALLGLSMSRFDKLIGKVGEELVVVSQKINRKMLTGIRNLVLIQIYNTQNREIDDFRNTFSRYTNVILKYNQLGNFKNFLPQVFGIALVCGLTVLIKQQNLMPPALIVSYFYLFFRLTQNVAETMKCTTVIRFTWPQFDRFYQWWLSEARESAALEASKDQPAITGNIGWKINNISYRYPHSNEWAIEALTTTIQPRQLTVITGSSGSGKSTLLNILLGLDQPTSGTIELVVDGKTKAITNGLLKTVGYVGPDNFLIDGTVQENIEYGLDHKPAPSEINAAITAAHADFIFDHRLGLGHKISEQGHGLSAGQKQRLSLVRALLRRPSVLILDEATSNLDFETEEKLVSTFKELSQTMTVVCVSHRTSVLAFADKHIALRKPQTNANSNFAESISAPDSNH